MGLGIAQCSDVWGVAGASAAGTGQEGVAGAGALGLWSPVRWAPFRAGWLSGPCGSCGVRIDAVGARCVRAAGFVHARVRAVLFQSSR